MHNHLRQEAKQEKLIQAERKAEARPIMPVLQCLKHISVHLDLVIKVHLMERFHRDLRSTTVLLLIRIALEREVVLYRSSSIFDLLSLARRECGKSDPDDGEDGDGEEQNEEEPCSEAAFELPGDEGREDGQEGDEEGV